MESATPLNTGLMVSENALRSRRGSQVTDDRTIYDELIAPMEATMMLSLVFLDLVFNRIIAPLPSHP
jgi:hypothetical protein